MSRVRSHTLAYWTALASAAACAVGLAWYELDRNGLTLGVVGWSLAGLGIGLVSAPLVYVAACGLEGAFSGHGMVDAVDDASRWVAGRSQDGVDPDTLARWAAAGNLTVPGLSRAARLGAWWGRRRARGSPPAPGRSR